jgi:3-hydroxyacyl-CoA dehydrogenase
MVNIQRVVILGANGTMGAGSAEVFAAGGCDVVLLARSTEKAREGLVGAQNMAKSIRIGDRMSVGTYDGDFDETIGKADLIFEALAEDLEIKKTFFERVDKIRRPESIVATVSSGLSITGMAKPCSEGFRRNFLGVHLFNPPNVIVGTEVIPHAETDSKLVPAVIEMLERRFGRVVTLCRYLPAFAGNRVGFKVLNECAQLAAQHGVAFIDYLIGPYTGRAMPPLSTIDLVGWDVHKAIVDNVHANTKDEAHVAFALPTYVAELIEEGHLGNKTPERGGFIGAPRKTARTSTSCSIRRAAAIVRRRMSKSSRSPLSSRCASCTTSADTTRPSISSWRRPVRKPTSPARSCSAMSATRSIASATTRWCASRATSTASWVSASIGPRLPFWST